MIVVGVAIAGGLGALLRFAVDRAVRAWVGPHLPWGILVINVTGSLALGFLVGVADHHRLGPSVLTVVGFGLLGSYTTFSTLAYDTAGLAERGQWAAAAGNLAVSLALGLAAAGAGLGLGAAL